MIDENYAPVCGLFCGACEFLGEKCQGCGYVNGRPFWTTQLPSGVCPIHDCCRNLKQLESCGLCEELPCKIFLELRDPNLSDEEFQRSLRDREKALRKRAELGTDKWLETF